MNIAIGGVSPAHSPAATANVRTPSSGAVPVAADQDGDADSASAEVAPTNASVTSAPGQTDVKA
jgi:hypothetical protein